MKEQYGGTMIQALKTVLPIKQKENAKVKKHLRLLLTEEESREKLAFIRKRIRKQERDFGSFDGSTGSGL